MHEQERAYAVARQAYQPFIRPGEEERLVAAFDAASRSYLEVCARVDDLLSGGDRPGAIAAFVADGAAAMAKFREALQADIERSVRGGTEAAEAGARLGASAHRWIIGVMVLSGLLCAAIGIVLVRGISAPVRGMTLAMRHLADGDLAVEVTGRGRGDEIGAMADAVEVFRSNAIERARLEAGQLRLEQQAIADKRAALVAMAEKIETDTREALEGIDYRVAAMKQRAEAMTDVRRAHRCSRRHHRRCRHGGPRQCADGGDRGRGAQRVDPRDRRADQPFQRRGRPRRCRRQRHARQDRCAERTRRPDRRRSPT